MKREIPTIETFEKTWANITKNLTQEQKKSWRMDYRIDFYTRNGRSWIKEESIYQQGRHDAIREFNEMSNKATQNLCDSVDRLLTEKIELQKLLKKYEKKFGKLED